MTQLLDLPTELLILILEQLGGRELRRNASNLTICRKWFPAAHPVYLSGLETGNIRIHGCGIGDLAGKWSYSGEWVLMHRNTRELWMRQLGHWWDQNSKAALESWQGIGEAEEVPINQPPEGLNYLDIIKAATWWQSTTLTPALDELFGDLRHFEALECLSLESLLDTNQDTGPQCGHLYSSAVATLLRNLPILHDLRSLTIDLCAGLNYDEKDDAHICEELAKVIPHIEDVRLRLKLICPSIFELQPDIGSSAVKLTSLKIKLHQPPFEMATIYTSTSCTAIQRHCTLSQNLASPPN